MTKTNITRPEKGKSIIDFPQKYVIVDLETTGLSPKWDKIIEIGAIKVENDNITDTFQHLVYPGRKIDSFIENLTGITNEMLVGQPYIDDILPLFDDFVKNNVIVGHNVNFDINFLYDNYECTFGKPFINNFIDTMRISRKLFPDLEHHRLVDIISYLHISAENLHRALSDCEYTYKCYEEMKKETLNTYDSLKEFQALFKKHHYTQHIDLTKLSTENDNFDENHILYGKVCVFTGILEKYTRQQAAQIVVNLGGTCGNSVTKKTNYLILGNNDYCSSIKNGKSIKQKKAEEYKLKGQDIDIIPESVFYDMISDSIKNDI